ncbi:mitochondrial large subunit ribosomal protein-domain-containing protein [Flammula alnicola]|nr:mitochondrial large subunit ribosomal protein-domain-containing protein [Flammula alnicola]
MLSLFRRQIAIQLPRNTRCFSETVAPSDLALSSVAPPPVKTPTSSASSAKKSEYFVPRNTRGNLPIYTDVRNAGGRHLVLIRNIEGSASALARDLSNSLFEQDTEEASRLKVQLNQSKHLVISGGRWKNDVVEWLKKKGF